MRYAPSLVAAILLSEPPAYAWGRAIKSGSLGSASATVSGRPKLAASTSGGFAKIVELDGPRVSALRQGRQDGLIGFRGD
jgi:hypothetical protein